MGNFRVYRNGKWRFNLIAVNGEVILVSESYTSKRNCLRGIKSVAKNSQDNKRFKLLKSKDNQFYFNLTARNGKVIGTSEMYTTKTARDLGISSVRANSIYAPIVYVEK